MNFLKNVLSATLGVLIAAGILFVVFFMFIALLSAGSEETVKVKNNSVLTVSFKEPLKDYGGKYLFEELDYTFENYNGLNHALQAIAHAKNDDKIKGINIHADFMIAGLAQIKALREALIDFKESGKFVYAYADIYGQKEYYLASVADSVFVNPHGELFFRGLASEVLYFKDIQEKSGISMEVVRHGKYKSAVEPFLSNKMSDANREQISVLLHALWNEMIDDVSRDRGVDKQTLNRIADELGARTPELAVRSGLIDRSLYHDEYLKTIANVLMADATQDVEFISLEEYSEYAQSKNKVKKRANRIAVIYAQGDILYGEGNDEAIGQGIIAKSLKEAREDSKVKAIVLRIDSPGGSALASDIIWREVEVTKKEKPVVVSMGNVAASGGYYLGVGAEKIFAEPTTITGSIGVFSVLPNIKGLADKIGINAEQVTTHEQSLGYSVFEPMSEAYYTEAKEGIETIYDTFLQRVAEGRNLTVAQVDSMAQGRVWSGVEALDLGLVDALGGLDDAVKYAAEIAQVEEYGLVSYPVYKTSFEEMFENLFGIPGIMSKERILKEEIGAEAYNLLRRIKNLAGQSGVQARLPYELKIQ
ncbi:signal peptide peptidase SppA [Ascidiimonas aurantiaca]|uniref:signal peptide peptidase SppA n=1 Tax=Ascidiimonas aurantiaca TaxID=1685432 RepID=UPI0030EF457D